MGNMVLFSKRIPSKIGFWNAQHHIANMIFVFLLKKLCIFPHTEGTSLFHDPLPPSTSPHVLFLRTPPPPHMGDVLCEQPLMLLMDLGLNHLYFVERIPLKRKRMFFFQVCRNWILIKRLCSVNSKEKICNAILLIWVTCTVFFLNRLLFLL